MRRVRCLRARCRSCSGRWAHDHPNVATSHNQFALLLKDAGEFAASQEQYERAFAIEKRALGPGQHQVAVSLNNLTTTMSGLADLLRQTQNYDAVLPVYAETFAVLEAALGAEHPNLVAHLATLGDAYAEQEKWVDAEPYYRRAVHLREQADDPGLTDTLLALSRVYDKMGRTEDARGLRERVARLSPADER